MTKYECFVTLLKCFVFFPGIWNIALVFVIKSVKMYGFTSGFFPLVQTDVLQNLHFIPSEGVESVLFRLLPEFFFIQVSALLLLISTECEYFCDLC